MIYPKFIKPGDTIGVTATSAGNGDKLHIRKLESAIAQLEEKDYKIVETPDVRTDKNARSAPKKERAIEFMNVITNDNIDAVITARGGEFLIEILPYLDFEEIKRHPKWVQGFSDTTGIGFCITTICDIATIYGENFGSFGMKPWHKCLYNNLEILEGKTFEQESFDKYQDGWQEEITGLEPLNTTKDVVWKNARKEEKVLLEGRIIGGCIDILHSLVGTRYDRVKKFCEKYKEDGIIWFFDNCELTSEEVLRTLWQFKEANWFENCKGIVFGRTMTRKSNTGITFEEAVMQVLEQLQIPIIFDADIGHVPPQMTIINGAKTKIECKGGKGKLCFTLK